MMKNKGQLRYRAYFGDIEKVEALGPHEVKFTFAEGAAVRDLLPTVAGTSIFSKAYYEDRDFSRASMDPPLGSGPYQVARADAGRTVVYTPRPGLLGQGPAGERRRQQLRRRSASTTTPTRPAPSRPSRPASTPSAARSTPTAG